MADDGELIPGLADDMARECLVRIPYNHFPVAGSVCKRWKREVDLPSFHLLRESNGHARPVVALVHSHDRTYRVTLFEPLTDTWTPLPPVPGLLRGLPIYCRVVAVERELAVIGGRDPLSWATTDGVYIFSFATATWRVGVPMPGPPRLLFAAAAGRAGAVAVAGGHDGAKKALRSAMAYRVAEDRWVPLPDMAEKRVGCAGVFAGNEFCVLGGYRADEQGSSVGSAEALDFGGAGPAECWSLRDSLATDTCTTPVATGDGDGIYVCKGGHVLVSRGGDTWRKMAALPEVMGRAWLVVALKGGGLFVVGSSRGGGAQLCYVLEGKEHDAEGMRWRKVHPQPVRTIQVACSFVI